MQKSGHFRQIHWFCEPIKNLETVLKSCVEGLADDTAPIFNESPDFDCVLARRTTFKDAVFLHFVTYEKGAPAAVIPSIVESDSLEPDIAEPPVGKEYIQSQLFCLARDNNLVWSTHNSPLREGAVHNLISRFIESQTDDLDEVYFQLEAVLDDSMFEKVFGDGIGEIDLRLGNFKPTLEALSSRDGLPAVPLLGSLLKPNRSVREIEAAADVLGTLTLKPGKNWEKPQVKELLAGLAKDIRKSHEDEFTIVTKSGVRVTREKMSVRTAFEIGGNRQILNPTDVRSALLDFMNELNISGYAEVEE